MMQAENVSLIDHSIPSADAYMNWSEVRTDFGHSGDSFIINGRNLPIWPVFLDSNRFKSLASSQTTQTFTSL